MARARAADADAHLAGARFRLVDVDELGPVLPVDQSQGAHGVLLVVEGRTLRWCGDDAPPAARGLVLCPSAPSHEGRTSTGDGGDDGTFGSSGTVAPVSPLCGRC